MQQWILGVVAVGGLGAAAVGDVINVPGDFPTIAAAMNAAEDGDEIVVAPGTYTEDVDVPDKQIILRSAAGPEVTIIDAGGSGSVVDLVGNHGPNTVLDGFTLTGGEQNQGAGVALTSEATIRNCILTGNRALSNGGGGIWVNGSNNLIANCIFSGNDADQRGGALLIDPGSTPTIINCRFLGNTAPMGGAIFIEQPNSAPVMIACSFTGNMAELGGAIYASPSTDTTVAASLIVGNEALFGGGIFSADGVNTVALINSTVTGNTALGSGGGVFNDDFTFLTVWNSTVWENTPSQIESDFAIVEVNYSNVPGFAEVGEGNIDADPMFVDPTNGDYRLQSDSPGIDAGHNNAIASLADTDLDGNPRFADDAATGDTGCGIPVVVDMGAYEFQGDPFPVKLGDLDGDGAVGVPDLLALLAAWGPCPEDCCLADLDLGGEVGVTDFLMLLENWG